MLEEYIDQATLELIRKFLKCGYIDFYNHPDILEESDIDTSQGSFISPILSNLYLHRLDCFVRDSFFIEWNLGNEPKFVSGYQTRKHLSVKELEVIESFGIKGVKETIEKLKYNEWFKQGLSFRNSKDINFRRLGYVRYVNNFIIGLTGTKKEANSIKNSIVIFLKENLLLNINETKSYICHSSDKNVKFLGYYVRFLPFNKIVKNPNVDHEDGSGFSLQFKVTGINQVQLRIPVEFILRRAVDCGYAKVRKDGKSIRAASCNKLSSFDDKQIVQRFSSIIRGLMKYYSPANRRSDLWSIVALYRKSCALTLADKHKLQTAAKTFKQYGPNLKITDPVKKKETTLYYPDSLKTSLNFKLGLRRVTLADSLIDPIQSFYRGNIKTAYSCQ